MDGFASAMELLRALVLDPRLGVLMGLVLVAAATDVGWRRIPNWLVLSGLLYALAFNAVHANFVHDGTGLGRALEGMALCFALTLPLYVLRAMGAGDVKLMAMVGAFLGPVDGLAAVGATFVAGGGLALAIIVVRGRARRALGNISDIARAGMAGVAARTMPDLRIAPSASAGAMPYGVAVALGTSGFLVARQLGYV